MKTDQQQDQCPNSGGLQGLVKMRSSSNTTAELPSSSSSSALTELVQKWVWSSYSSSQQPISSSPNFHEGIVLKPVKVLSAQPGRFVCSFVVPAHLTNAAHELHQGVIASLVDNVGAGALVTLDGKVRFSVDLNVTYTSPAHVGDEVEIEAKVLKYTQSIGIVSVDLTNKSTGRLVAQGRHTLFVPTSKL